MKIAVVGGGIFGVTAAWTLARHGHSVDLFEKTGGLLGAASAINQYRIHQGFHYPRSPKTIEWCLQGLHSFRREYEEAIIDKSIHHYYAIAQNGSRVTAEECIQLWDTYHLEYKETHLDCIRDEAVTKTFQVKEYLFDLDTLRKLAVDKLEQYSVRTHFNTRVTNDMLEAYDTSIIATYAQLNDLSPDPQEYNFQLCEKVIVKLPKTFKNKSVVILDGPFSHFNPNGKTNTFIMGDNTSAIHAKNTGTQPVFPAEYKPLLNDKVQKTSLSHFNLILKNAEYFFPEIIKAELMGSLFTIHTILTHKEVTDERPTLVKKVAPNRITIFSGKIDTCVDAAEEVLKLLS